MNQQHLVAALHEALYDPNADIRFRAATRLAEIEQASPETITILTNSLDNPSSYHRLSAVNSLLKLKQISPDDGAMVAASSIAAADYVSAIIYKTDLFDLLPKLPALLQSNLRKYDPAARLSIAATLLVNGVTSSDILDSLISGIADVSEQSPGDFDIS